MNKAEQVIQQAAQALNPEPRLTFAEWEAITNIASAIRTLAETAKAQPNIGDRWPALSWDSIVYLHDNLPSVLHLLHEIQDVVYDQRYAGVGDGTR